MEFGTIFSVLFCLVLCERCRLSSSENGGVYTNTYAVHIEGGPAEAARVAEAHNFLYLGEVSALLCNILWGNS